jgi:hypothetical protein
MNGQLYGRSYTACCEGGGPLPLGGDSPQSVNTLTVPNRAYRAVAAEIGVQLASTADPDKAFAPCTAGAVLGVHYDTLSSFSPLP